jgi:hypothetical protein
LSASQSLRRGPPFLLTARLTMVDVATDGPGIPDAGS